MAAGAQEFAAKNADKFDFSAVGMKDERDFAAQVDAIENFVTQKYNIIVVAPADSKAMVTPLAKALKAGIVAINIDVALDEQAKKAAGIDLAFFGPDNRAGAKLAGDALGQSLGAGGKIVILEGNPEADNAKQRKLGFEDSVKEHKLKLLDSKTAHRGSQYIDGQLPNPVPQHPRRDGCQRLDGAWCRQSDRRCRKVGQYKSCRLRQHSGRTTVDKKRQDVSDS